MTPKALSREQLCIIERWFFVKGFYRIARFIRKWIN